MSAFDDLTLGEVDVIEQECLGGVSFSDADPLKLAGAVMFITNRRANPALDWATFKNTVSMGDIRRFSEIEMAEQVDTPLPTP